MKVTTMKSPSESLAARKGLRPVAVQLSQEELIETSFLDPDRPLPLIVRPKGEMKLEEWAPRNRDFIERNLRRYGAILFRGFGVDSADRFERNVNAFTDRLMSYTEGATPRLTIKDKVYTSTEFPPEYPIALHNELSYIVTYPTKLWFCCVVAPPVGGETPIADVRRVYRRISPATREKFERLGWMLVRNYGDGLSLPWQTVFHTDDKSVLAEYCRANKVEVEWKDDTRLRTRHIRPATRTHPVTGETVWFNHVAFWHVSSLLPDLREEFLKQWSDVELPYNTFYGDGSTIEPEVVEELRAAYDAETVMFRWEPGDFILIDNISVAHGRSPYSGPRRILAAMGDAYTDPAV
ncbi:MAG TPA: TauD/TfdA family dioxygenase [Thermoanaerobaculia bacterium]|jgi:alpha-ketoglutarate-dependent taurine dioxygenase